MRSAIFDAVVVAAFFQCRNSPAFNMRKIAQSTRKVCEVGHEVFGRKDTGGVAGCNGFGGATLCGRVMKTEWSPRFRVGLSGRKRRAGLSGDAVSLVWWCVSDFHEGPW
jgi:hypothetical protein